MSFSELSKTFDMPNSHLFLSTIETPVSGPKDSWEQEVGTPLLDDYWQQVLRLVHSSPICVKHGLLQCKVVHKFHYTNLTLSRIYPNVTNSCNRCQKCPGNHSHMFWFCPRLTTFWSEISKTLRTAYNTIVSPDPLLALFGTPCSLLPLKFHRLLLPLPPCWPSDS